MTDLPARLGSATILGREIPILLRDAEGIVWRGYCDLVYRDALTKSLKGATVRSEILFLRSGRIEAV